MSRAFSMRSCASGERCWQVEGNAVVVEADVVLGVRTYGSLLLSEVTEGGAAGKRPNVFRVEPELDMVMVITSSMCLRSISNIKGLVDL